MKRCKTCLVPDNYPGADLQNSKMCHFCEEYKNHDFEKLEKERKPRERDLEQTLKSCKGAGQYDCIVLFSGGKDSAYLLHKIRTEYKLRVLAITIDAGGYTNDIALKNIRQTLSKLAVDHILYTPQVAFLKKLFKFLLQNQLETGAVRTVCYVCHPLAETFALNLAMEKGVPLILEGLSPGQPEPEIMLYEMPQAYIAGENWLPEKIRESGFFTE